jgi:hypothetical protein
MQSGSRRQEQTPERRRRCLGWLRSPLLHFIVLGALLFAFVEGRSERQAEWKSVARRPPIELDAGRIDELRGEFSRQVGRAPTPPELERLIASAVDDEILYREAVARGLLERDGGVQTRLIQKMLFLEGSTDLEEAGELLTRAVKLGLHEDDIVVRRILIQKMRLIGSQLHESEKPSERDIAERYARDRDRFREPDRLSFVHVFSSKDRRPGHAREEALRWRGRIVREGLDGEDAIGLGDPFPLGHHLEGRSRTDLDRRFGAGFGEAAFGLEIGTWSDPIPSAYGHHLLWIEGVERGEIPPLEAVADRIRRELEQERRDARFEALLTELRTRYEVVVEPDPHA